jgi:hypothetical protein
MIYCAAPTAGTLVVGSVAHARQVILDNTVDPGGGLTTLSGRVWYLFCWLDLAWIASTASSADFFTPRILLAQYKTAPITFSGRSTFDYHQRWFHCQLCQQFWFPIKCVLFEQRVYLFYFHFHWLLKILMGMWDREFCVVIRRHISVGWR